MHRALLLFGAFFFFCSYGQAAQQQPTASAKPRAALPATRPEMERATHEIGGESAKLPVRRVVLYKNGIGYFEHLGRVHESSDVHIDFTSAQLNDVLKSLTVLDLAGGRITGVDYNSEAPLARRLATLRLALGDRPTEAEFLSAMRGARIEVRGGSGPVVTGRLLSVERKTRNGGNWTVETDEISLISDDGEVRSVDLNPATSVKIAERDLNAEIAKYMNLIAAAREQDVRRMTISTAGSGDRDIYVSYISEVPIWKTTYRLVLPTSPGKKPLLQGWAIVDNTVGEDWNNVELSLVAGAPHSFIQQLSEPYYGRRPEVPLPASVELSPQTHAATLSGGSDHIVGHVLDPTGAAIPNATVRLFADNGSLVALTLSDSSGQYSFSGLASSGNYRVQIQQPGFRQYEITQAQPGEGQLDARLQLGSTTETVAVSADAVSLQTSAAEVSSSQGKLGVARRPHAIAGGVVGGAMGGVIGGTIEGVGGGAFSNAPDPLGSPSPSEIEGKRAILEAEANGQSLGDLFEYKLKDRVTLKKNQSALVPIAQTEIEAEKVSLWSGNGAGRPLRALWLKNTSGLTLDGGSFSVLENEVFAGEGLTDPIKPGEKRLISYATDLGLLVEAEKSSAPQHVRRVKILKGVMTQVSELHEKTTYTVRNQDETERALVIEHPARVDWKLASGAQQPEEKAPGTYRFRLQAPSKATASLPIEEIRTLDTTYQLSNLDDDQIGLFLKQGSITPEMAQALQKITAQKDAVAKLEDEMEQRQHDIDRIVDDQGRLRENMKALRGSAEEKALLQRYAKQLDDQETQLAQLRKQIEDTEAQRDKANDELEKMIADLQIEATL